MKADLWKSEGHVQRIIDGSMSGSGPDASSCALHKVLEHFHIGMLNLLNAHFLVAGNGALRVGLNEDGTPLF